MKLLIGLRLILIVIILQNNKKLNQQSVQCHYGLFSPVTTTEQNVRIIIVRAEHSFSPHILRYLKIKHESKVFVEKFERRSRFQREIDCNGVYLTVS